MNNYILRSVRAQYQHVLTQLLTQLFLGISKPHAPVKVCSIAHWVNSTLSNAGIDTTVFSAHSTQGASTSKAIVTGVTLSDVIHQADWSAAQVFFKFYFKQPVVRTLKYI